MRSELGRVCALGVLLCVVGCQRTEPPPAENAATSDVAAPQIVAGFVIGAPIRHANLAVFPLLSPTAKMEDRLITLDEGLRAGTVEIMERGSPAALAAFAAAGDQEPSDGGGPSVNELLVVNRAELPLYLMPGEVIVGGQQDRTIGNEYVIAPGKKPVPIDVFCVEHGRWHKRSADETASLLAAASRNSSAAFGGVVGAITPHEGTLSLKIAEPESGKFVGSVGNVGKEARLAVQQSKSQTGVWDRVAATNQKFGATSSTDTFTANYAHDETAELMKPFLTALAASVADQPQVVGVLVAINGKMDAIDAFESTPLFRRLWPKLLKSYALDALNAPTPEPTSPTVTSPEGTPPECTLADAEKFLTTVAAAEVKEVFPVADLVATTRSTDNIISFSAREKRPDDAWTDSGGSQAMGGMGGGGGGFGRAIHIGGGVF